MTLRNKLILFLMAMLTLQAASYWTQDRLLLNITSSLPTGFYATKEPSHGTIARGTIIAFKPPAWTGPYLYGRHWIPEGTLLLKPVAAVPGDSVNITNNSVYINGKFITEILKVDGENRPLPDYRASFIVPDNNYFPLSTHIKNSFDGRYFGCISMTEIAKIATPLLTF